MSIVLSLLVLTTAALLGGAYVLFRRGLKRQGWLMLILAVVIALNIAIWTVPSDSGESLVTSTAPQ